MKLFRFLIRYGSGEKRLSKSDIQRTLATGLVKVDGVLEKDGNVEIGKFTSVSLDGVLLREHQPVYLMMNKPAGYLSATKDDEHPTVMELVDGFGELHLAGRLDRATTGLLLLTNDGDWSRRLTEPKEKVPKVYEVMTADPISADTAELFQQGIYFAYEDKTTSPAELVILTERSARLTIYEGRYHQVKRMFHAVGNRVVGLHRVSVGRIVLDENLAVGECRELCADEVVIS